jgi:hypothetical protein
MQLQTTLRVNDNDILLNAFTQNYIGNILRTIVLSLEHDSQDVTVEMDDEGFRLYTEKGEIPVLREFKKLLIESTIKGMLSSLKGIFWLQHITITTKDAMAVCALSKDIDGFAK